jgi:predicted nucleotidyltransferase
MTNNPLSSLYTKEIALLELQDFMFDTMASAEMALDWFCDRFNVSATDEVIDFVVDTHFAMFADQ